MAGARFAPCPALLPGFASSSRKSRHWLTRLRTDWIHEVKHDGYRTVVVVDRGEAWAFTRNGFDWSDRYPGIIGSAAKLTCRSAILDGEVIVQDARGVSDFDALKSAAMATRKPDLLRLRLAPSQRQ